MVDGVSRLAPAWVFATVSETVLGDSSDVGLTMALAAQLPTAAGSKSYQPFSVAVATLATTAVVGDGLRDEAAVYWAMVR